MRTLIDIPESDLKAIKKIAGNRSEFVRQAIRVALEAQRAPEEIHKFFGIFAGEIEDGVVFQDRMRNEW